MEEEFNILNTEYDKDFDLIDQENFHRLYLEEMLYHFEELEQYEKCSVIKKKIDDYQRNDDVREKLLDELKTSSLEEIQINPIDCIVYISEREISYRMSYLRAEWSLDVLGLCKMQGLTVEESLELFILNRRDRWIILDESDPAFGDNF